MIHEGYKIFSRLAKKDQKNLVKLITDIEKDNLNRIF
jgi:hypothetical protein